jgi:hypothetical protein
MGTARASTINRFLTRRCSRGSSGIDHSARLGSRMRSPGRVRSLSLPSTSCSIHRDRLRELILIPKADGRLRKRDKQAVYSLERSAPWLRLAGLPLQFAEESPRADEMIAEDPACDVQ